MSKQLTMKAGVAMSAALVLAVALAVLAFAYQPVGAQTTSADVTRDFSASEVEPGETLDVTITLNTGFLVKVTETLPAGWTYQSVMPAAVDVEQDGQMITFDVLNGEPVTYTVMAPGTDGSGMFSGMFAVTGTPNIMVGGDTTVTVATTPTTPPAEPDLVVNRSTENAGADVRVTIEANAGISILGGTDISVTLSGFGIPSSIDEDDVIIYSEDFDGNPDSVAVDDSEVTLTVPLRTSKGQAAGQTKTTAISGAYTILFKSSAGLTNPALADKTYDVTVSDADSEDQEETIKVIKTASVKPTFVTRGGDATVTAKGLRDGTTTVYLLEMNDDEEYVRGPALGTGTADDGVVEIEIDTDNKALKADATAADDEDVGVNKLRVIDSNNGQVGKDFTLGIKPTVKLGSETAKRSANLEISVSDWYYGDIDRVTIAGLNAEFVGDDVESIDVGSDEKATFKVTVPGKVRTGDQEVKVYGDNPNDLNTASATATVDIVVLPLSVSPSTVVPGHRVTITGSGFVSRAVVTEIAIGSEKFTGDDIPEDARATSSGRVAVTVAVPLTVGDGDMKVSVTAGTRTGEGEITVPEPEIELSPSESVPGSVISVIGTGFAADSRVEVRFDGDIEEVGRANGSGDVSIRLEIPSDAGVGATNEVMVEVRSDDDDVSISATADHETPGSAITVPETAQVGTLATISGTNFEPFTSLTVDIGGRDATPTPGPETDKNGAFELEARVPRLSAGSHTITIKDGSPEENSVTETFDVVTTPVVSTPQEVFGSLGDNLVVVWRYDNATATWASYAPGAPAEINDLAGVSRGNIVWVQVTANADFQGATLYGGWNLVTLE